MTQSLVTMPLKWPRRLLRYVPYGLSVSVHVFCTGCDGVFLMQVDKMQQLMALNQLERQVVPCALVFNAHMPSVA